MRRLLSISLLLLFSLPLISPLFAASLVESNLPACCRRNSKHHCAMTEQGNLDSAAQQSKRQAGEIRERCPCCPTVPGSSHFELAFGDIHEAEFASLVSRALCVAQTQTRLRISFDRSRQKRGPPSQQA